MPKGFVKVQPLRTVGKTVCGSGHPLVGDNLVPQKDRQARCRICKQRNNKKYYDKIHGVTAHGES